MVEPGPLRGRMRRRTQGTALAILSILGLLLGSYLVHLFQAELLPELAPVVADRGGTLALPIRATIIVGNLVGNRFFLTGPVLLVAAVWIGLFWKPDRLYGPAVLVTACIATLLLFQTVFLVALFQMAEYLPATR